MNPQFMRLLQMLKSGGNPQQLALSFLEPQAANNPILRNLLSLAKDGKGADIETIARQMLKEQGLDFDKEFGDFQKLIGLKK